MDHPICLGCAATQTFEIINISPMHLSTGRGNNFSALIRPGKPQHLVTRKNKILSNSRSDKARSSCNKNSHMIYFYHKFPP